MQKQWVLRKKVSDNLKEQLLSCRNIKIEPDYDNDLRDPLDLLNMEKAVRRIISAIKNNDKIVIFSDYDADGVSAAAIFYEFFKKINFENFHVHIPDRHLDGYGLTLESIDEFTGQKAKLLITLDCGITDCNEVKKAVNAGMDVVIIDHHLVPEILPPALAIVDPKQKDDKYPFKEFCGAGLAFKTIQAIINKGEFEVVPGWEKWLLDIVAIATIADMVPLVDENRVLVYYGLMVLKKTKRTGLLALFRRLGFTLPNINEDDISFMIAPRINITSRMSHASASFELLTTESIQEADWIASRMEALNVERKSAVEKILKEIEIKLADKKEIPAVIVAGDLTWNTGILGLTATRLAEKYDRSVFLWGKERAKEIKGSCRSDGTINLVELMENLPLDMVFDFGGHTMAGGFSLPEDKINILEQGILSAYEKIPKQKVENNILEIDAEIPLDDINEEFYSVIEKFAPFGVGNPKPVFLLKNLEIKNVKKFGNGGLHLQLDFKNISAIGFFIASEEKYNLSVGQKIDLVATLEKSFFRASPELRLRIVDVKLN